MGFDPVSYAMGKQAGGGGGVTVEPLSVTENGTYQETGKAYSPVTVEIDPDEWVRPSDWPDLDSIEFPEGWQGVYLTYDLRKTPGNGWIGLKIKSDGTITIERGHLENRSFVADETFTATSDTRFARKLNSADGNVQLWRASSTQGITSLRFMSNSDTKAEQMDCRYQPCVERRGALPDVLGSPNLISNDGANGTGSSGGTFWLEKDKLALFGNITQLQHAQNIYASCYNLQEVDISGWNFAVIQSLTYTFQDCRSIKKIDFHGLNAPYVTDIRSLFSGCAKLEQIDISGANFPAVDSEGSMLECVSLRILNMSDIVLPLNILPAAFLYALEEYFPQPAFYPANLSCSTLRSLSRDSFIRIFNSLPSVESTYTVAIGLYNIAKLTSDDIAIATEKGWTVA